MIIKDISTTYDACTKCGSYGCIYAYHPSSVNSIEKLAGLVDKKCDKCKSKLNIVRIKVKIKGLK